MICILIPIVISSVWIIFKDEDKLDEIYFKIRFQELYANKLHKTRIQRSSLLIFFVRRIVIITMIVGFEGLAPSLRIILFYLINIAVDLYMFGWTFMHTKKETYMDWFNEICFWLLLLHMFIFTDFVTDKEIQY